MSDVPPIPRIEGDGWLVLVGGGEFTFGETLDADEAWVAKTDPDDVVGFVPAASGSEDYAYNFIEYLDLELERQAELIPVYRVRDARRGKNADRVRDANVIYLGGGVPDHLLEALEEESPVREALTDKITQGGMVVAIAAAAQAAGSAVRGIRREFLPGLRWLSRGVVEPNFQPGHDRRLRELLATPGVQWGLGIPASSAVLLGPEGQVETVGLSFYVEGEDGDLVPFGEPFEDL